MNKIPSYWLSYKLIIKKVKIGFELNLSVIFY